MSTNSDHDTTIQALKDAMLAFVRQRDWQQFHAPKNLAMAIAAEAGELMEHFLWVDGPASRALMRDPAKAQAVKAELADILLLVLEFANVADIDLALAATNKLAANAAKYPVDRAKGNCRKYTEL